MTAQKLGPNEFAVTIGFDAFRIAIGAPPKRHSVETVCRWLLTMAAKKQKKLS